jgi:putative membrane protein
VTAPLPDAVVPATPGDPPWERLHPLTPLLRGGRLVLIGLVLVGQQGMREPSTLGAPVLVALAAGVPLAILAGYVSWRRMRYRVTSTELQVESGVLTRRSRRVPLARVQAVDVVRPLYARVVGAAELRLEVVGGGDAEAPLAFLGDDEAKRLRTRLLALSSGRSAVEQGEDGEAVVPAAPEHVLVVVPTGPLVWSVLLGPPLTALVLTVVALLVAALVSLAAVVTLLAAAAPVLLGVGSVAVRRLLSEYGFTVAESPDGLRLRHGLLDTRSQTIPAGRIQTVRVLEPLLWRWQGWVRVEVDVAGYGGGSSEQAATGALLPVAPRALADQLVARILDGPLPTGSTAPPGRARWRAPLSVRRLGVVLDDRHLVTTSGVLTTTTDVVPLAKVQSLRLTQGPWQRRLRLTSLHADTAGRRLVGGVAAHRDVEEGTALLAEVTRRAASARRR